MKDKIKLVFDLGSSKISCMAIKNQDFTEDHLKNFDFDYDVLSCVVEETRCLNRGVINNIDETAEIIQKIYKETRLNIGSQAVSEIYVGITGAHIEGFNSTGVVSIKGQHVLKDDVNRVLDSARAIALPQDQDFLHILPQNYVIDHHEETEDPIGMMGVRLESYVHIVKAMKSSVENTIQCFKKAGMPNIKLCYSGLGSSEYLLSSDEKKMGVALVDIGAGTTDIMVYHNNRLLNTIVLPVGGDNITQDLAIGLRTPHHHAEKIKKEYGFSLKGSYDDQDSVEIEEIGGHSKRLVSQSLVNNIIESRIEEILQLVNAEILKNSDKNSLSSGLVITGGSSQLGGLRQLLDYYFEVPVKVIEERKIDLIDDVSLNRNNYHTLLGLAQFTCQMNNKKIPKQYLKTKSMNVRTVGSRVKSWITEIF